MDVRVLVQLPLRVHQREARGHRTRGTWVERHGMLSSCAPLWPQSSRTPSGNLLARQARVAACEGVLCCSKSEPVPTSRPVSAEASVRRSEWRPFPRAGGARTEYEHAAARLREGELHSGELLGGVE